MGSPVVSPERSYAPHSSATPAILPLGGILLGIPLSGGCSRRRLRPTPEPQIQDNSFLIEEAYNQEPGVVQTIQTYARVAGTGDWAYTLTQEWPVPDEKNQLSFTIPIQGLTGPIGIARGLGDLALNYRYQLVGSGEAAVALSPRATLLVPTGDYRRALGSGGLRPADQRAAERRPVASLRRPHESSEPRSSSPRRTPRATARTSRTSTPDRASCGSSIRTSTSSWRPSSRRTRPSAGAAP